MMRLFFGLAIPGAAALAITEWRDRYFQAVGRPVPAANLHITLAFLGAVSEHRLERLCLATDQVNAPGRFTLALDEVGYWPKPGIGWLGPTHVPAGLKTLATSLAAVGSAQGSRRAERRYRPHVTLYRACEAPPPPPLVAPEFRITFDQFHLYASHRSAHGVSYVIKESWDMRPRPPVRG